MTVKSASAEQTRSGPVAIRFEQVSFSYGSVPVLEAVSFHVHQGEFAALVGPNGAGKTTVLKLLLGLEKPDGGTISLFENMGGIGGKNGAGRKFIGYVPQHANYDPTFPISVKEVVRMGRLKASSRSYTPEDEEAVLEALDKAEISDLASRSYSALSGGQRRRVLVARALASRPLLLVLDEPTANMDSESEARLFKTLGNLKGGTTILIVTHDAGFVSSLTDVVFCVGDRSFAGSGCTVVRHRTEPVENAPPELYGGNAVKVRHDVALSDSYCCGEEHIS